MRKVLLAVAVAALAIAAGPPALAEGVHFEKVYKAKQLEQVSQDLAFTARAVYHPSAEQPIAVMKTAEREAGRKREGEKSRAGDTRTERAALPAYHLLL